MTTTSKLTKETVLALMTPEEPGVDRNGKAIMVPTAKALKALVRGLMVVYRNQTLDEQSAKSTNHSNGIGFTGTDANILTDFAETVMGIGSWTHRETGKTYARKGPKDLSTGQAVVLRKLMVKYAAQIAKTVNMEREIEESEMESVKAEQEAERRNEAYFEERGSCTVDRHEEALMAIDPQTNGEGLSLYLEAAVGTPESRKADHIRDLNRKAADLRDLILKLKADSDKAAWELGLTIGELAKLGEGSSKPSPAVEPETDPMPEPEDTGVEADGRLRMYGTPTASAVPTLEGIFDAAMPSPVREPAKPAPVVDTVEDEFDALFPKQSRPRTETNVTEALEEWFTGKRGGNRYTRPTKPLSQVSPWTMANIKVS
jgi:hypothetical protein